MENQNDPTTEVYDIVYASHINTETTLKDIAFITSRIPAGGLVLDVGCGTGRHLIPLRERGYSVVGIDTSINMLKQLREKLQEKGLQAKLRHQDILSAKFNAEYDAVICYWNAFSEIAKTDTEALETFSVFAGSLQKGGVCIIDISDPTDIDETFLLEETIEHDGKEYRLTYKVEDYDHDTNITRSKESIDVYENGTLLKQMQATVIQKWWDKDSIGNLLKESDFSKVEFLGEDYQPLTDQSEKIIIVATK